MGGMQDQSSPPHPAGGAGRGGDPTSAQSTLLVWSLEASQTTSLCVHLAHCAY